MNQTRRTMLSAIGAAGVTAGTASGSETQQQETTSTAAAIEPNDVVVATREIASRSEYDEAESQGPVVRPGQPGRARWQTTVDTAENGPELYWLVTWGKAADGWVPAQSIKPRAARYETGDPVELTTETQTWEVIPTYFEDRHEIRSYAPGTSGALTQAQFFDRGVVWWQVQYDDFKGWTPETAFLPPEEATRAFSDGDRVRATASLGSYRAPTYRPGAYGDSLIGTIPLGETGTIQRGYSNKHGHKWWLVTWDEIDADGWAVEHNLTEF